MSRIRIVAIATVIVAVSGYLVLVIAASRLGPGRYLVFASFWSALYLAVGGIFGIQQEVTRQVASQRSLQGKQGSSVSVVLPALVTAGVIALMVLVSSPIWADQAFKSSAAVDVSLISLATVLYAGQSALVGSLAGQGRWRRYSAVLVIEAVSRLAFVSLAAALFLSATSLAVAVVVAMAMWLAFLVSKVARDSLLVPSGSSFRFAVTNLFQSIGGAASSAILIAGFPLILSLAAGRENPAILGVVVLVVTLTRAPVLVPMNAFLGMLVGQLSANPQSIGWRTLRAPTLLIVGLTMSVAVGGFFVGSQLIQFVFGSAYIANQWFIAGAAVVAGFVAILSLSGAATLAAGYHGAYLAGWLSAAALSTLSLALPIELEPRVIMSLAVGPIGGALIHLIALARVSRRKTRVSRPATM